MTITDAVRAALVNWYRTEKAKAIRHAEAFETGEYASRPSAADLRRPFPFFP